MKTTSSPESYKYWTFFVSVRTRENFSPARKVRSTTAPLSRFFTFVRTNAPPLPGFTCWNSTIRQTPPSSSMCIPFLNWFVLTVSAIGTSLGNRHEFLGEHGQHLAAVLRDDDQILDPDPAEAGEVDPRFDRDDVPGLELVFRLLREPRGLVDEQPDAVPEAVAERLAEVGVLDPLACGRIGGAAGDARADRIQTCLLRLETDGVGLAQLVRKRPGRERARAIGAVAADRAAGVDDDGRLGRDLPVAGMGMRHRAVLAGGDDRRERGPVGAELVEELLEPPGELALRPAREPLFGQPLVCLARDLGRPPDRSELALVLDRPQRFHHAAPGDRKSTRLNSSHVKISYAVFCLKKKKKNASVLELAMNESGERARAELCLERALPHSSYFSMAVDIADFDNDGCPYIFFFYRPRADDYLHSSPTRRSSD